MQRDKRLQHNCPDIVIVHKNKVSQIFNDVACPGDGKRESKEDEKTEGT